MTRFFYIRSRRGFDDERCWQIKGCIWASFSPTRQDVHRRLDDDLLWARMKVLRTSLFVVDVENTLHRRRVRIGRCNYVLRTPGRKRTSECDVLWTSLAEWGPCKNSFRTKLTGFTTFLANRTRFLKSLRRFDFDTGHYFGGMRVLDFFDSNN